MKLYPNVDVDMAYQNFGSTWLGILRGSTENIELVFNGLFNHCATHGNHQFQDHLNIVSIFWTSRQAMRRFFFNNYFMPRCNGNKRGQGKLVREAMKYALSRISELGATSHESYLRFANKYFLDTYSTGTTCAERPDSDMKDAILAHAFQTKESHAKTELDKE